MTPANRRWFERIRDLRVTYEPFLGGSMIVVMDGDVKFASFPPSSLPKYFAAEHETKSDPHDRFLETVLDTLQCEDDRAVIRFIDSNREALEPTIRRLESDALKAAEACRKEAKRLLLKKALLKAMEDLSDEDVMDVVREAFAEEVQES